MMIARDGQYVIRVRLETHQPAAGIHGKFRLYTRRGARGVSVRRFTVVDPDFHGRPSDAVEMLSGAGLGAFTTAAGFYTGGLLLAAGGLAVGVGVTALLMSGNGTTLRMSTPGEAQALMSHASNLSEVADDLRPGMWLPRLTIPVPGRGHVEGAVAVLSERGDRRDCDVVDAVLRRLSLLLPETSAHVASACEALVDSDRYLQSIPASLRSRPGLDGVTPQQNYDATCATVMTFLNGVYDTSVTDTAAQLRVLRAYTAALSPARSSLDL